MSTQAGDTAPDQVARLLALVPYLLARGPDRENALLYLAVPAELLSTVRPIAAGAPAPVTITARVRDGRSDPVGVPILDIVSIARR